MVTFALPFRPDVRVLEYLDLQARSPFAAWFDGLNAVARPKRRYNAERRDHGTHTGIQKYEEQKGVGSLFLTGSRLFQTKNTGLAPLHFAARGGELVHLVYLVFLVCLVRRTRETRQTRAPDRPPGIVAHISSFVPRFHTTLHLCAVRGAAPQPPRGDCALRHVGARAPGHPVFAVPVPNCGGSPR